MGERRDPPLATGDRPGVTDRLERAGAPRSTPDAPGRPSPVASPNTVGALLGELTTTLARARVPLARDEARDLLAALLDVPRFWPSLHRDAAVDRACAARARRAAARRAGGAPFAYAVGRAAFRYLTLDVDDRVLIPRQETELLVELALAALGGGAGVAADVGTGSGAIALALASEGAFDRVVATDVSLDALAVARRNASRLAPTLRAPVELRHGSLLAPLADVRVRLLAANPPYIAYGEAAALPPAVRDWEPPLALLSGDDGMAATAAIVRGAPDLLEPGGALVLEVDCRRASLVAALAASGGRFRDVAVRLDLAGRERFVVATA